MTLKNQIEHMKEKNINESRKLKSARILDAVIIGFLFGIIVYSVVNESWGFLTLIPIYLIYKLMNKSKTKKGNEL